MLVLLFMITTKQFILFESFYFPRSAGLQLILFYLIRIRNQENFQDPNLLCLKNLSLNPEWNVIPYRAEKIIDSVSKGLWKNTYYKVCQLLIDNALFYQLIIYLLFQADQNEISLFSQSNS